MPFRVCRFLPDAVGFRGADEELPDEEFQQQNRWQCFTLLAFGYNGHKGGTKNTKDCVVPVVILRDLLRSNGNTEHPPMSTATVNSQAPAYSINLYRFQL